MFLFNSFEVWYPFCKGNKKKNNFHNAETWILSQEQIDPFSCQ